MIFKCVICKEKMERAQGEINKSVHISCIEAANEHTRVINELVEFLEALNSESVSVSEVLSIIRKGPAGSIEVPEFTSGDVFFNTMEGSEVVTEKMDGSDFNEGSDIDE